jgi:xanthine dehydrogenase accessory factor
MLFADHRVVLRGGGDLATGVAVRLHRAGFPVVICELAQPLTVRRTVAFSTAISNGVATVEGITARLAATIADVAPAIDRGEIAVIVAPDLPDIERSVVVDARLAKRVIDTSRGDAPLVIALGPAFTAGVDCHAVVETQRGWARPSRTRANPGRSAVGGKSASCAPQSPDPSPGRSRSAMSSNPG